MFQTLCRYVFLTKHHQHHRSFTRFLLWWLVVNRLSNFLAVFEDFNYSSFIVKEVQIVTFKTMLTKPFHCWNCHRATLTIDMMVKPLVACSTTGDALSITSRWCRKTTYNVVSVIVLENCFSRGENNHHSQIILLQRMLKISRARWSTCWFNNRFISPLY